VDADVLAGIRALLAERPEWLVVEREKHAPGAGRPPGTAIGERPVSAAPADVDEDDAAD